MTYNEQGKRTSHENLAGQVTTTAWDCCHKVSEVQPDGSTATWDYDDEGCVIATSRLISLDMTSVTWLTTCYRYDALGRKTEAYDAADVTTFLYDSFGSITNETVIGVAGTNTIIRHWDTFGRDAGYALNGTRQSTLTYDPATGRLLTMYVGKTGILPVPDEAQFKWSYLPGSDLKSSLAYPNGLSAFWAYDVKNQLLQVCNAFPTNVISQYDYTYGSCRNGKRGYTWETEIFVVDTVGLQPRDGIKYALFGRWLFKDGTLIMARWKLSGEGECSCCKDALEDIAR